MKDNQTLMDWDRLMDPKSMQEQIESYKIITDAAMFIIFQEEKKAKSAADRDANNLYQMTALKCLSVLKLVEKKLHYKNDINGLELNVYDPFGLKPIIRAQFEAYGHFNNVYLQYGSEDEKQLKHDLWVMCGLMNRQKFSAIQAESTAKKEKEKREIEELKKKIEDNPCFKSLNQKAQQRIFDMADRSDWKLTISGDNAIFAGWQQLTENAGANDHLKNTYKSFSLGSHPSNVSVFQFTEAYNKGKEAADFFTSIALKLSKFYMSLFIADYCKHSPEAKIVFDQMPELHQLLINSYNRMFRGEQYQVNDIWNKFGPILEAIIIKAQNNGKS